jgi:hypothetical protein
MNVDIRCFARSGLCLLLMLWSGWLPAQPLTSAFTYQGELSQSGSAAAGLHDFRFRLYDAASGGAQVGAQLTLTGVAVSEGLFSVPLDFGPAALSGDRRWLEIDVRPAGAGAYQMLSPRSEVTAAPYAWSAAVALADSVGSASVIDGALGSSDIDATQVQRRVTGSCPGGQYVRVVNADGTVTCGADASGTSGWGLTGNAGTVPGTNFLGTTDNQALQLRVNNSRAVLIQPDGSGSHSLVGGYSGNLLTADVHGAVIGGGGIIGYINAVTDHFGTVGGGAANVAGNGDASPESHEGATVAGGRSNLASGSGSAIGGGVLNQAAGYNAIVAGGAWNEATGAYAAVGGGYQNDALSYAATVAGGNYSSAVADYASVGGGSSNTASGPYATVPGGNSNSASGSYSFAAGQRAKAMHDGAFVWADSQGADFSSSANDTFRVRALNGASIQANNSAYAGIIANDSDGDGLRSYTNSSRGNNWSAVYAVNSGTSPGIVASSNGAYAGYFNDAIYVTGGCTNCTLMYVAQNTGDATLEVGELVAPTGVGSALRGGVDPVLRVQQSGAAAPGVVGVVWSRVTVTHSEKDGEPLDSVQATDGAVQPDDYLLIVVQGLARVKVATGEALTSGQHLRASGMAGAARGLRTVKVDGVTLDEGGPVVGVLLDLPDAASGLAPVMVTLR